MLCFEDMSEPVRWTNWGSGHPRAFLHTMRDCVRMVRGRGDWMWHETPCQVLNWQYRFICEYGRFVLVFSVVALHLKVYWRYNWQI